MARLELDWTENDAPLRVVEALRAAGHQAYLAGGCVRDLYLERPPKDFDVATSASPDEVRRTFAKTIPVQPELGVTMVLWGDDRIETTTFRTEGPYLDGRRPSRVERASAELDVQRRDFTINGLLLDPLSGEIVDHVGGIRDLESGILRCIGDPRERFQEDHLRILRAVRFVVRFGLELDTATWEAMCAMSSEVGKLSGERIHDELRKMFVQAPFARCLALLQDSGTIAAFAPELAGALEAPQARDRLSRWLAQGVGTDFEGWLGLLGLPLCGWWTGSDDCPQARAALMDRLRASKLQIEAAELLWRSWPQVQTPLPKPSDLAPILRNRHWSQLRQCLDLQDQAHETVPPLASLDELRAAMPSVPPPWGDLFQKTGIPRGPLLGKAIREADRRNLDEGAPLDESLVREVSVFILGNS